MYSPKSLKVRINIIPLRNLETMVSKTGVSYTPQEKKRYMQEISDAMKPFKGHFKGVALVKVKFMFMCPRPKSNPFHIPAGLWSSMSVFYKGTRPDIDNYVKPLQDAISLHIIQKSYNSSGELIKTIKGAGVIDDDQSIVDLRAIKLFAQRGQEPCIKIHITEIKSPIYTPDKV